MTTTLAGKRIAFLVAPEGVEQVELTEPWKAVEEAGGTPELVSTETGKIQAFNHLTPADTFEADKAAGSVSAEDYDGLVLPGGVANPDFLRVCGADCNGTLLPIGPMLVYEQLPESNPVKKVAAGYITQYEAKYGKESRTTFGGHAYDTFALIEKAVPEALKRAKPGTKEFRAALRDALEASNVVGTHGVFVMTPQDHNGLDNRARVMIRIDNGKWVLVK